jgi:hypothetical protein
MHSRLWSLERTEVKRVDIHFIYDGVYLQKAFERHFHRRLRQTDAIKISSQGLKHAYALRKHLLGGTELFSGCFIHFVTGKVPALPPSVAARSDIVLLRSREIEEDSAGAVFGCIFDGTPFELEFDGKDVFQPDELSDGRIVNILEQRVQGGDYVVLSSIDGDDRPNKTKTPIREAFAKRAKDCTVILLTFKDRKQKVSPALRKATSYQWLAKWTFGRCLVKVVDYPKESATGLMKSWRSVNPLGS